MFANPLETLLRVIGFQHPYVKKEEKKIVVAIITVKHLIQGPAAAALLTHCVAVYLMVFDVPYCT